MKLIEADKVKRVMKDYWKAQVDKALTLTVTDVNEANKRINSYLEHNHELLKLIDELPSAEPDTTTHDSIPAETDKNDGDRTSGDCISRQRSVDTLRKMQTYKLFAGDDMLLINQAEAQTELMMLPSAEPKRKKMTNKEWVDFLSEQFTVSRTSAREMLHGLMRWKAEDNFKKQFSGGRNESRRM